MKIITADNACKYTHSNECTVWEYPFEDTDINCAVVKVSGRYPSSGYVLNQACKELVYITEGHGVLHTKDTEIAFNQGDLLHIDKQEAYFWEGDFKAVMSCAPSWHIKQYQQSD